MLAFQFLDMVDGLTRLDPVRNYPMRAGELVAQLCGAADFVLTVDVPGLEGVASAGIVSGRSSLSLPLRCGRQVMGEIVLFLPEGQTRLEAHDLRTARWAARIVGRCLSYAARMRHESTRAGAEGVTEALQKAPLTPRERDVVALLIGGASTRQIATEAHLTVGTVHTYLKRIYPKLGVRSRLELVVRMIGTDGIVLSEDGHALSNVPHKEGHVLSSVPLKGLRPKIMN